LSAALSRTGIASSRDRSRYLADHFAGFDQKILSMNARCMTARDIQAHLEELYQAEVN
jgi:hypothetical protein